jgi:hypothetical protein
MDINDLIHRSRFVPGNPYWQPDSIVTADQGPYGVPYTTPLIPLQNCVPAYLSVSDPIYAHPDLQAQAVQTTPVIGWGAAPTSGIYTGVEDHCG